MDKYRVIGTINFILGSVMLGISLIAFLLLKPMLEATYSDFGVQIDRTLTSLSYGVLFLAGILNWFLAIKLLGKSADKEKWSKLSVPVMVITGLVGMFLYGWSQVALFGPLYSLTAP